MNGDVKKLFGSSVIEAGNVPELDLYMDQIITLIENGLSCERRNPQDKLLTKTMINNYSKDKLLQPIKGKKYSKEHVLMMLMIYYLKSAVSIPDIKLFFDVMCPGLVQNGAYSSDEVRDFYDKFTDIRKSTSERLCEYVESGCPADDTELFLTLISISSAAASAAQKLLDMQKTDEEFKTRKEKKE